ncbi:P-type conjugative transfer protein TrbJ [Sphingobium boeckii]|nr:P-type conjugative transfer protein TrbJ [Sphingobium boeckii]
MALTVPVTPVHAIVVFDPSNYAQNVLTAARTLQQINQQMQSLQNEAAMLTGMAKNLTKIDFPELQQLTQKLQQIDRLMRQAQGVDFDIDRVDDQFRTLFRTNFEQALRSDQRVMGARSRLDTAMAAFRQTMTVQAQVVGNVREDATALAAIVAKSQGAEGGLQAQQATNQLLALTAKQQFQIQSLMAAQYRAEAIEQARRVQAEAEARTATKQFLGSGKAYTPD